jgi:DNA-directed RNA polymerase alpha subunit
MGIIIKDKAIDELELSVRAFNCFKRAGITYISDFFKSREDECLITRNLSRKALEEIVPKIEAYLKDCANEIGIKELHKDDIEWVK